MAYQLSEINAAIRTDTAGFLARCDESYQQRIDDAADKILERTRLSPIVLLSGPSGSGKTTTALKLEEELERRGTPPPPPGPPTGTTTWSPPCAWTWSFWTRPSPF